MSNEQISQRELSERDILISLRTEVAILKESTKENFETLREEFRATAREYGKVRSELEALKVKVNENTNLRKLVIGSILSGLISLIISTIGIISKLLEG